MAAFGRDVAGLAGPDGGRRRGRTAHGGQCELRGHLRNDDLQRVPFGPPPGWELYESGVDTNGGAGPTYFAGTLNPSITGSGPPYPWIPAGPAPTAEHLP